MITLFADNKEVPVNMIEFSDGAITFKLDKLPEAPKYISINVCPSTPVYRVREEILMISSCIFERDFPNNVKLYLNLPYMPYGRCDRVFEEGNPNGLKSFLFTLEHIGGFDEINVYDLHNEVAVRNIINEYNLDLVVKNTSQKDCLHQSLPCDLDNTYDMILAPDKGSVTKAAEIACHYEVDVYNCGKERDVATGKIIRSTLPEGVDFADKIVLIPDDLCDGGYTFIKLAEQVKAAGAKQVDLYVTHLIASKGLDVFGGLIDNIYCRQTVGDYVNKQNLLDFNSNK